MIIHERLQYSSPARSFKRPFISPFTRPFTRPFTKPFTRPFTRPFISQLVRPFIEDESFVSYSSPPPFIHHLLHSFSSSFIHFPFSHINSFSSVIHGVDRPASSRLRFSNDFGARKPSPSKVSLEKGAQHPHQA